MEYLKPLEESGYDNLKKTNKQDQIGVKNMHTTATKWLGLLNNVVNHSNILRKQDHEKMINS